MLSKESEDGNHLWTFKKVTNHHSAKLDGKQTFEVELMWDIGEKTWEPLNVIKADDLVTGAEYVKEKNHQDQPYWKWANKYYLKNPKKFH